MVMFKILIKKVFKLVSVFTSSHSRTPHHAKCSRCVRKDTQSFNFTDSGYNFCMKKALIIHGWGGNPNEKLFKYLKNELSRFEFESVIPEMPTPDIPIIKDWVNKINEVFDDSTDLIVGHSIGCQAVLRFLESADKNIKVSKVLLIAPWMELDRQAIEEEGEEVVEVAKPWMEAPIDFEKIRKHSNGFITIFSGDDSYVPLNQVELFKEQLNAKVFTEKKQGHFTDTDGFESLQTDIGLILN